MAAANPGEILVSRTVRDLVVGSDVTPEVGCTFPTTRRAPTGA